MLPSIFDETRRPPPAIGSLLRRIALISAITSGCSAGSDPPDEHTTARTPPAPATSSMADAPPGSSSAPSNVSADNAAAISAAASMVTDQLRAACGSSFNDCSATPGCNEILACAARAACTGATCYCSDARCEVEGPCRTVIAAAPGARVPDASNPSPGPAAEAAGRVGACVQGLAGGTAGLPGSTPVPAPPGSPDAGVSGGRSDAG
jgi:hypothetical protein